MHLSLLEIPAGIFPHQLDGEISREHLSIVRVAAEVYVDARVRKLLQLLGLVVEDNDGLILVQTCRDLIGRLARLDAAARAVRGKNKVL